MAETASRTFTVRVAGTGGTAGGLGALVSARHVVTCAHVVNAALGRPTLSQGRPPPGEVVRVTFPLLAEADGAAPEPIEARVVAWLPPSGLISPR